MLKIYSLIFHLYLYYLSCVFWMQITVIPVGKISENMSSNFVTLCVRISLCCVCDQKRVSLAMYFLGTGKVLVLKAVFTMLMLRLRDENVSTLFAMMVINGPELICNCEFTYTCHYVYFFFCVAAIQAKIHFELFIDSKWTHTWAHVESIHNNNVLWNVRKSYSGEFQPFVLDVCKFYRCSILGSSAFRFSVSLSFAHSFSFAIVQWSLYFRCTHVVVYTYVSAQAFAYIYDKHEYWNDLEWPRIKE